MWLIAGRRERAYAREPGERRILRGEMARTTSPTAARNTEDGFRLLFGSVESLRRGHLAAAAEQRNTPSRFRGGRGARRIG